MDGTSIGARYRSVRLQGYRETHSQRWKLERHRREISAEEGATKRDGNI